MMFFENNRPIQSHLEIPETVTETQAVISRGEDVLDRVQQVAHGIQEHVRQLLDLSPYHPSSSNCYAGSELAESAGSVDNPRRRC